jgi:Spy/CpxP family protein refolding chaperone
MKRLLIAAMMLTVCAGVARAEAKGRPGDFMKKRFGLSDDQAAKLKEAFKAQRETAKPLIDKLRLAQDQLRERVDSKASDKEVQAALDAVSSARATVRAQREKFQSSLASILTPTQRARMELAMARRVAWRRHPGRRER